MDATRWDVLSLLETTPADGTAPLGSVEGRKEGGTRGLEHKTTGQCVPAPLGSLILKASTALRMPWQRLRSTGPTAVASAAAEMAL